MRDTTSLRMVVATFHAAADHLPKSWVEELSYGWGKRGSGLPVYPSAMPLSNALLR